MTTARAAFLTLAFMVLLAPGALAISCERATSPIDHAVCANPALRRADTVMGSAYARILEDTKASVKADFIAQQRAWLRARDGTCAQAAVSCLAREYDIRQAQLDAILSRVGWSDLNFLMDTTPLLLSGSWKATAPRVLPGQGPAPLTDLAVAAKDDGLPPSGTRVTGQPGKLCYDSDCFIAGLQPLHVSDLYGMLQAASLGLEPSARAYALTLTLTKVHVLSLVEGDHGTIRALFDDCAPLHEGCVVAEQVWVPQDKHAAVLDMLDQASFGGP